MGSNEHVRTGRRKRKKKSSQNAGTSRLDGLEGQLVESLRGLKFRSPRIHRGSLKDFQDFPYMQFKFPEDYPPEDVERYLSDGCELRTQILNRLNANYGDKFDYFKSSMPYPGVFRETIMISPNAFLIPAEDFAFREGVIYIALEEIKRHHRTYG